jgi:hypothetical protein
MPDFDTNIKIICLESEAFKALVSEVATQIKKEFLHELDPWIDEKEAMDMLRISSKTTFQKYRDDGNIDYRRLSPKQIVYRRQSILDFIESSSK